MQREGMEGVYGNEENRIGEVDREEMNVTVYQKVASAALVAFIVCSFLILIVDATWGSSQRWKGRLLDYPVRIISGPYAGKEGNLVSTAWLGNGWNLRATVNIPRETPDENNQRRAWVGCWSWELEEPTWDDSQFRYVLRSK